MKKSSKLSPIEDRLAFKAEEILRNDPTKKTFDLAQWVLKDEHLIRLCEALKQNDYIEEIDLSNVGHIRDRGVVALVAAVPNLKKLNISGNAVGDEGAKAIAGLKHLKELNIGWNRVADEGALALSKHKGLERICFTRTKLTDQGMKYLVEHTRCFLITVDDCDEASRNYWARVKAVCAYNRKVQDVKLLPGQEGAMTETREEYVENHWKEHYQNPKNQFTIYNHLVLPYEVLQEMLDPSKGVEIKPLKPNM